VSEGRLEGEAGFTWYRRVGDLGTAERPPLVRSPALMRPLVAALADARWELFEGASHSTHLEQPERFMDTVSESLAAHD
jgi:pimeloyl-ACP methyl ester carboxylesterase